MCGNVVWSYFRRYCDLWNDMLDLCLFQKKIECLSVPGPVHVEREWYVGCTWVQEKTIDYIGHERLLDETSDQSAFADAI